MTTLITFIILSAIIILISQQQTINELEQENKVLIEIYLQGKEKEIAKMEKELKELNTINLQDYHWESDFDGEDVGHDDIPVVGVYTKNNRTYYINMEDNSILESWENGYE